MINVVTFFATNLRETIFLGDPSMTIQCVPSGHDGDSPSLAISVPSDLVTTKTIRSEETIRAAGLEIWIFFDSNVKGCRNTVKADQPKKFKVRQNS